MSHKKWIWRTLAFGLLCLLLLFLLRRQPTPPAAGTAPPPERAIVNPPAPAPTMPREDAGLLVPSTVPPRAYLYAIEHRPTTFLLDASASQCPDGSKIQKYDFSFGDGSSDESTTEPSKRHTYRVKAGDPPERRFDVSVIVTCESGETSEASTDLTVRSVLGALLARGIYGVEVTDCYVDLSRTTGDYECTVNAWNPHDVAVELKEIEVAFLQMAARTPAQPPPPYLIPASQVFPKTTIDPQENMLGLIRIPFARAPTGLGGMMFDLKGLTVTGKHSSYTWQGSVNVKPSTVDALRAEGKLPPVPNPR